MAPEPRKTTADDLNQFDVGARISFDRPATSSSGPKRVRGKLLRVTPAPYWRGNMPQSGYVIHVAFPARFGGYNTEEFGPVSGNFPVEVGDTFVERREDALDEST